MVIIKCVLPAELRQALAATSGTPLQVLDPVTNEAYFLVSAKQYERILGLLGSDPDLLEMSPLLADLSPEDWEDAANYDQPAS